MVSVRFEFRFESLKSMPHGNQPTRSTTQILVVTHQYGISALVSSVAKCQLFSQATRSQAFKNSRAQVNVN